MERTCGRCRTRSVDFKKIVDPQLGVLEDSICRACRTAEPRVKRPKKSRLRALQPARETTERARPGVLASEAREALQSYVLGDVRDPVDLITRPCHFSGGGAAMCLDLLDRRGRADDGNVIPCGFYVRAARGDLRPEDFIARCVAIAEGRTQTPAQAKQSMAMSARYDAVGGVMFEEMCRAVSARQCKSSNHSKY